MNVDLFGVPIVEEPPKLTAFGKPKRNETPRGYAGTPGKGPQGHFCRDCRHLCRKHMGKTYLKCWLMQRVWSGGPKTDIRAKSPACEHWASKIQVDPDATERTVARNFYVRH
jgi:hypothetical protein